MSDFAAHMTPSPGSFIAEELEARGWTQLDLAFVLGVTTQAINQIIQGKRGIGSEMAKALGKAFDVPPEFFLNLQAAWDLAKSRDPDPAVERRARLQQSFPVREMIKRGWFEDGDSDMLDAQIASFFKVTSLAEVPHMNYAAKKTYYDETPPAQLAWLFRVRQLAEATVVPPYSEKKLRDAVGSMSLLRVNPEEVRHVPRLLAECGVRFIAVEALPKARIDGVCFWLNDGASPVIGMSLQKDRIDNFWFVLRHEIEHVLRRHGADRECIDIDLDAEQAASEEKMANEAAADFCVPAAEMNSFYARVKPFFYENRVVLFAQRQKVHPGLVVGQIQRRTGNYAFLKRHQVKVREFVTSNAMSDGWGNVAPVTI